MADQARLGLMALVWEESEAGRQGAVTGVYGKHVGGWRAAGSLAAMVVS